MCEARFCTHLNKMSEHTQRVAEKVWDALGGSVLQGSILQRIEAVVIEDLNELEEALVTVGNQTHNSPGLTADQQSAYVKGFDDAIASVLAVIRARRG